MMVLDPAQYQRAIAIVVKEQKASASFIQRHLQIGYNMAVAMLDKMMSEGICSPPDEHGKRRVLITDNPCP